MLLKCSPGLCHMVRHLERHEVRDTMQECNTVE